MSIEEYNNPFKLSPEENAAYFKEQLLPELAAATAAVEQPVFILIGGQSGAGKSRLTVGVKNELDDNAIVLDADIFRPSHPNYYKMLEAMPLKVFDLARIAFHIAKCPRAC